VLVCDETERLSNLKKHGLDFRDAHLVDDDPNQSTQDTSCYERYRRMDVALLIFKGRLLTLISMEIGDDVLGTMYG
jgi:uncharacterized DUF497 family protein